MIPVPVQPEPDDFDHTVRQPGQRFLSQSTTPLDWSLRAYWRAALPALRQAYGGYCAYFAMKIPKAVGNPTVDHFLPRKHYPQLAYEWSNFRLASALANSRKRDALGLVDPFTLSANWFVLTFPGLLTLPQADLPEPERAQVQSTIDVLKLNDPDMRQSRLAWVMNFALGKISYAFLCEEQPFLAQELQRQGLHDGERLQELFL